MPATPPLTLADREVDPRVFEHPLRVIVLDDGRLGREQRRVEPDRLRQIVNGDVYVQALHQLSPLVKVSAGLQTGTQAPRPQQFSVR